MSGDSILFGGWNLESELHSIFSIIFPSSSIKKEPVITIEICDAYLNEGDDERINEESEHNSDSSFHPSNHSESSTDSNDVESDHNSNIQEKSNSSLNITQKEISSNKVIDNTNLIVSCSDDTKKKMYMCIYCKKLQSQLPRHLELKHKYEEEVKKFSNLPKSNPERKKILDILRKRGTFMHNTDSTVNTGTLIVSRRPSKTLFRKATDFITCVKCKGTYSSNNIRHHFQQCNKNSTFKKERSIIVLGRAVECRLHSCANQILKRLIFPVLREDDIIRLIRYDELIISYGNKMSKKYRHQHQHDMIRARLRLLGRLLLAIKKINKTVTDFASIYNPKIYDDCIKAIQKVAKFDEDNCLFENPSVASSLGTLLKHVGHVLRSMYIKSDENEKLSQLEKFLKLLEEDYTVTINKNVQETHVQRKRHKKVILPSMEDIRKLNYYLRDQRNAAYKDLKLNGFSLSSWMILAETTLTSIQLFNRRRAGEIERILIEDFKNPSKLSDEHSDLNSSLNKYIRITIRGKLSRTVPVLLNETLQDCIKTILQFRRNVGVKDENPYIFGIPSTDKRRWKYLRACVLMRKFAEASDTKIPCSLRGTLLRKHIATKCITLDINDNQVRDLANFMGHEDEVHRKHYRQSIIERDLQISHYLKNALGGSSEEEEVTDSNKSDVDNDDNDASKSNSDNERPNEITTSDSIPQIIQGDTLQLSKKKKGIKIKVVNNRIVRNGNANRIKEKYKKRKRLSEESVSKGENSQTGITGMENYESDEIRTEENQKKKRKVSPFGQKRKISRRIKWDSEERKIVLNEFKNHLQNKKLPSFSEINELKKKYPLFVKRTNAQIKTWIHNQLVKTQ